MKKTMLLAAAVMCGSAFASAQTVAESDTLHLQEVEVLATRATSNTPIAFTNVSKQQIEAVNHGTKSSRAVGRGTHSALHLHITQR